VSVASGEPSASDRFVRWSAAVAIAITLIVLLGWGTGRPLEPWLGLAVPSMKSSTALAALMLAGALALVTAAPPSARLAGRGLAALAGVLAIVTLSAWFGGPGGVVDELFASDPATAVAPGRMSPSSAVAVLLLSGAVLSLRLRRGSTGARAPFALVVVAGALSLLALVGLVFDAGPLYQPLALRGMSPLAAVVMLLLSAGLATLAAPGPTRRLVTSTGPGGLLVRRTLPVALLALLVTAYVQLYGRRSGWYDMGMGIALMVVTSGAILVLLLHRTAVQLERQHLSLAEQRFAERLYQQMLDQSPAAIFVKDPEGRYVVANQTCAQILGAGRNQVIGCTDHDLLPVATADELAETDRLVRTSLQPIEVAETLSTPEGHREFLTTKFPIQVEGRDEVFVGGIAPDVTERQEIERRLAQVARLETVGELAGGIAHDFNNLLTVISGMTELAVQDLEQHPVAETLGHVLSAASRAADLSRELLTFARRDSAPAGGSCVPNDVARELERLLGPLIGAGIELRIDLGSGVGPVAMTATRLEQVLMNLALNARDAMQEGGELTIATRAIQVDHHLARRLPLLRPGRHVGITVTDTGVGMSPEVRDRALEPFFTTKGLGEGTGLGLASTYGVVTQAGGTITIESEPRRGTTVTVLLPVTHAQPPAEAPGAPEPGTVYGAGRQVLVIEDEPAVRQILERSLVSVGFAVTTAEGSQQANEVAARLERPDLVVCDVVLRDGVGPAVVDELRRRWPAVPVLYVSGYTDRAGRRIGPDDPLLHKPFTAAALYRAVAARLEAAGDDDGAAGLSPSLDGEPGPRRRGSG
jgi:two-component system, cell cycle sensor histidine kinase and response regulator CckA